MKWKSGGMDLSLAMAEEEVCCCRKCRSSMDGTGLHSSSKLVGRPAWRAMPGEREPLSRLLQQRCSATHTLQGRCSQSGVAGSAGTLNVRVFVKQEAKPGAIPPPALFSDAKLLLVQFDAIADVN